jgi:hypothetical protein
MGFIINFRGLVCHLFDGSPNTAVFPDVQDHGVRLLVRPKDVVKASFRRDPSQDEDGLEAYDIHGRKLTMRGVTNGNAGLSDSFKTAVPALTMLVSCKTLDPSIIKNEIRRGLVAGYLKHPAGRFAVQDYMKQMGLFSGQAAACVARTVRLSLNTRPGAKTVTVTDGNQFIRLASNARIRIDNDPLVQILGHENSHFSHYYMLFRNCHGGAQPSIAEPCSRPHPRPKSTSTVECSNSQFP